MLELAGWAEALRCRRGFCAQGKLLAGTQSQAAGNTCRAHGTCRSEEATRSRQLTASQCGASAVFSGVWTGCSVSR